MGVVVKKSSSVVVRPSELVMTDNTAIKLSSFDKGLKGSDHIVVRADNGEVHIQCTGEGVEFVEASVDCALKVANLLEPLPAARAVLDELALYYPAEGCYAPTNPLMMMQVTEFSCGGFVVGVTWNHGTTDGCGMAQFLQAVGKIARGQPAPSVVPIRWDDALPSLPSSIIEMQQLRVSLEPLDLACLDINPVKRDQPHQGWIPGSPCTMFEVVAAVLWRCRTRATMSKPESPVVLWFAANVRKHVGAKEGYYGNGSTGQLVMAASGMVTNGDIMDLIKMIKQAKDRIPDKFTRGWSC
ncbi:hypothetical protein EJB05_42649, partial [Eragrostis curvula]